MPLSAWRCHAYPSIWPGGITPVLIRDPATGERCVVSVRYRCRLSSWTAADEKKWDDIYNARRDKLDCLRGEGKREGAIYPLAVHYARVPA